MNESGLSEEYFVFYRSKKIVFKKKLEIFEKHRWRLENFHKIIFKIEKIFNGNSMTIFFRFWGKFENNLGNFPIFTNFGKFSNFGLKTNFLDR